MHRCLQPPNWLVMSWTLWRGMVSHSSLIWSDHVFFVIFYYFMTSFFLPLQSHAAVIDAAFGLALSSWTMLGLLWNETPGWEHVALTLVITDVAFLDVHTANFTGINNSNTNSSNKEETEKNIKFLLDRRTVLHLSFSPKQIVVFHIRFLVSVIEL